MNIQHKHTPAIRQHGMALLVVMVMLLLSSLVVLSSTRLGWLNEKLVGIQSDHQRAFAAAEALVRDAERDIRGSLTGDVPPCTPQARHIGCTSTGDPFFPWTEQDLDALQARLAGRPSHCLRGICLPGSTTLLTAEKWKKEVTVMTGSDGGTPVAARYGEFTGATPGADGNPLLRWSRPGANPVVTPRAWYWVEVFWYADSNNGLLETSGIRPNPKNPFVYRITAHVQGLKTGTRVWLRSVYVPYPMDPS